MFPLRRLGNSLIHSSRVLSRQSQVHVVDRYRNVDDGLGFRRAHTHALERYLDSDLHCPDFGELEFRIDCSKFLAHIPQLILLSPCAFIAQDYYVLPHLAEHIGAHDCLLLRARLIGRIFLTSDCITFVVQLAGSAMGASVDLASTGEKVRQNTLSTSVIFADRIRRLHLSVLLSNSSRSDSLSRCGPGLGTRCEFLMNRRMSSG